MKVIIKIMAALLIYMVLFSSKLILKYLKYNYLLVPIMYNLTLKFKLVIIKRFILIVLHHNKQICLKLYTTNLFVIIKDII